MSKVVARAWVQELNREMYLGQVKIIRGPVVEETKVYLKRFVKPQMISLERFYEEMKVPRFRVVYQSEHSLALDEAVSILSPHRFYANMQTLCTRRSVEAFFQRSGFGEVPDNSRFRLPSRFAYWSKEIELKAPLRPVLELVA